MECFGNFATRSFNDSDFSNGVTMENDMKLPETNEKPTQLMLTALQTGSFAILCPVITACNLVVIVVFARMKKLNGQSVYKASTAASDLLFGIIAFPLFTFFIHTGGTKTILLNVFLCIRRISIMISLCTMLAMGFDRLLAMMRPITYDSDKSRKVAVNVTTLVWCVLIMITIPTTVLVPISTNNERAGDLNARWGNLFGETMVLMIALLLVWINNITVYCVVRKKMNVIDLGDIFNAFRLKRQKHVAITLCIMTGFFTVSTVPLVIHNVIIIQDKCKLIYPEYLLSEAIVFTIFITNNVWNCYVYSFRNKEFREKIKKIFFSCGPGVPCETKEGRSRPTNS